MHDLLVAPYLIGAHDLAPILRRAGARLWAAELKAEEEAHIVRVEVAAWSPVTADGDSPQRSSSDEQAAGHHQYDRGEV